MIQPCTLTTPTPTPRRASAPPPTSEGLGDCFEKAARWVAGKVVGVVFGTSGLVANAAAGGARGTLHAARVESNHQELLFQAGMTANMAALGALGGGPAGAVLGVAGGHLLWRIQGEKVRERVLTKSDQWVDKVLEKLPGDPDQAGRLRRVANGVVGEVVGTAAGAVGGTFAMFEQGEQYGQSLFDEMTGKEPPQG
ncbi:MAG: hypothetical protein AB7S38_34100 [Vulcanimicrobiota bacterium]